MPEINERGELIGANNQPGANHVSQADEIVSLRRQHSNLYREATSIPEEIKGWNWGAFLLSWIWAIGNNVWIGLLVFIPYLGFIMVIVLGVKGSEWAWSSKNWDSIDHFLSVQKKWATWGFILAVLWLILLVFSLMFR
jgi:hypothetical protein